MVDENSTIDSGATSIGEIPRQGSNRIPASEQNIEQNLIGTRTDARHEDFGEYIPDSRKENHSGVSIQRVIDMTDDDLREMIAESSSKSITKSTIWPRPNAKEYRESGKSYLLYEMHVAAWKLLSQTPKPAYKGRSVNSRLDIMVQQRQFAFAVANLRALVEDVDDALPLISKIQALSDRAELEFTTANVNENYHFARGRQLALSLDSLFMGVSEFGDPGHYEPAQFMGSHARLIQNIASGRNQGGNALTLGSLLSNLKICMSECANIEWPDEAIGPDASKNTESTDGNTADIVKNAKAESASALEDFHGRRRISNHSEKLPTTVDDQRGGYEWRNKNQDIPEDDFLRQFSLRGGQYGNWVTQGERAAFLNLTYDALMDLASAAEIQPISIGLSGDLGVSWGARGRGDAAAHYEPGLRVINLTRHKGSGSLAHEWSHALDHWLYRTAGHNTQTKTVKTPFLSAAIVETKNNDLGGNTNPMAAAMSRFMEAAMSTRLYGGERDLEIYAREFVFNKHSFMEKFLKNIKIADYLAPPAMMPEPIYQKFYVPRDDADNIRQDIQRQAIETMARDIFYEEVVIFYTTYNDSGKLNIDDIPVVNNPACLKHIITSARQKWIESIGQSFKMDLPYGTKSWFESMPTNETIASRVGDHQKIANYVNDKESMMSKNIIEYENFMAKRIGYRKHASIFEAMQGVNVPSKMVRESKSARNSAYYASPEEIFARAFECCIQAAMHQREYSNPYLVSNKIGGETYPSGDDMEQLLPAFFDLTTEISNNHYRDSLTRENVTDEHPTMYL